MYKRETITGYAPYEIDTNGVVYSKKGKPLKYSINHNGYCIVNFYIDHKRIGFAIHTLVAKQFLVNDDEKNKTQVNHIDGNKQNNNVKNLEWVTPKKNMQHAVNVLGYDYFNDNCKSISAYSKKTGLKELSFDSIMDAARYVYKEVDECKSNNTECIQNSIWRALNNYRKSYLNYFWKYN